MFIYLILFIYYINVFLNAISNLLQFVSQTIQKKKMGTMDYDNTSNYGKKIKAIESCPEFNSE